MAKKKPQGPWIVIANHLLTGRVVFLANSGAWEAEAADAALAETEEAADYLLDKAREDESANVVVGPDLISAGVENGQPYPLRNREVIRATGPTVRTDLGYQAAN